MLLFYVRHGDPTYRPDALTPLGHRQAESVAKRLALFGIDEIYSSDSTRAMETAQPLCKLLNIEIKETFSDFHESRAYLDFAPYAPDGERHWAWAHPEIAPHLLTREVREMGDRWYEHPSISRFDLGKGTERIGAAADAFLASLGFEHDRDRAVYKCTAEDPDKRIALFAHEGVSKAFLSRVLDIPYPLYAMHFEISYTGVTVIEFHPHPSGDLYSAHVLTHANDSHFYRDGLPLDYQHRIRF